VQLPVSQPLQRDLCVHSTNTHLAGSSTNPRFYLIHLFYKHFYKAARTPPGCTLSRLIRTFQHPWAWLVIAALVAGPTVGRLAKRDNSTVGEEGQENGKGILRQYHFHGDVLWEMEMNFGY